MSLNVGVTSSLDAELWVLSNGLMSCVSLNLLAVEIELDAKIVLGWVSKDFNSNLHYASLIMDCRLLSTKFFK